MRPAQRRTTSRRERERAEPQRTCVGCQRIAGQSGLVRIVRRPDGSLVAGRHEAGRGAWLCQGSPECFEFAVRRRAFARVFRGGVAPGAIDALRERLFH
ncbi:MAG TPA: YlxR family protein [Acidimicrobiia bacterium]|nr:YlxR family protein [Acidimicrobiia bacterium]